MAELRQLLGVAKRPNVVRLLSIEIKKREDLLQVPQKTSEPVKSTTQPVLPLNKIVTYGNVISYKSYRPTMPDKITDPTPTLPFFKVHIKINFFFNFRPNYFDRPTL